MRTTVQNPINSMILEERRKSTLQKIAGVLAVVAGVDLMFSAYITQPVLQSFLSIGSSSYTLPKWIRLLVGAGGILVILSGFSLHRQKFASKSLMSFGIGVLVLGLVAVVGQTYYAQVLSSLVFYVQYWVGLALAYIAIWVGKRSSQ